MIKGSFVLGGVVLVLGLGVIGATTRGHRPPTPHVSRNTVPVLLRGNKVIGPSAGQLRVAEFSDFECPACRDAHEVIAAMMMKYPGRLTVVFHHFPIYTRHPNAIAAARAAECAADQGHFRALYDTLFASQDMFGQLRWVDLASRAGVPDTSALATCLLSANSRAAVDRDQALGISIGVHSVPSLVVDTLVVVGTEGIRAVLERELAGGR